MPIVGATTVFLGGVREPLEAAGVLSPPCLEVLFIGVRAVVLGESTDFAVLESVIAFAELILEYCEAGLFAAVVTALRVVMGLL